jgi:hypothetical protein
MRTPEGAIQLAEPVIYTADTLRRWNRQEIAALWCKEFHEARQDWPSIKEIMGACDIGQGTAHRALLAAGGGGRKARERYLNSEMEKIV